VKEKYISAGDIEKYSYCPLSWYLSHIGGDESEKLREGEVKHRERERKLSLIRKILRKERRAERRAFYYAIAAIYLSITAVMFAMSESFLARILLLGGLGSAWLSVYLLLISEKVQRIRNISVERLMLWLSMISTTLVVFALAIFFAPNYTLAYAFQISAIFWLLSANLFFYLTVMHERHKEKEENLLGIHLDDVEYVDMEEMKTLYSKRYGISGRPDAIIREDGYFIPVEIKTGRTPRGPLFSHIMQLMAYCLLVEENYGTPPPFGILRYEKAVYRIEYTEEMKRLVLEKAAEIRRAMAGGEVHRNHRRAGKCAGCSRRSICPERLV